MQFSQDVNVMAYVIRSYGPGEIVINEPLMPTAIDSEAGSTERGKSFQKKTLTGSVVVSSERLMENWPPQRIDQLIAPHLVQVLELTPEIVLIGTGKALQWPPAAALQPLRDNNIGIEVMDTAAACRTYNILMLEGRRVAAALMMI